MAHSCGLIVDFPKDGMLLAGVLLGVSQQAYLLCGDSTISPVGCGLESLNHMPRWALQNVQNWGKKGGGEASFVTERKEHFPLANTLPESCI